MEPIAAVEPFAPCAPFAPGVPFTPLESLRPIVPFAPLGRGFLAGHIDRETAFTSDDVRAVNPRFTSEARAANERIVDGVRAVASRVGATPAQVALSWVLAQGDAVVPIPGATTVQHVEENTAAAAVTLTADDLAALDRLPAAVGSRY